MSRLLAPTPNMTPAHHNASPSTQDCRAIIAFADAKFGRVDCLVNAAAITDRGTIGDTTVELWDRMMAVNLRAPFLLTQEAVRLMRRDNIKGSVVNICTMSAHGGQPFLTATAAGIADTAGGGVVSCLSPGRRVAPPLEFRT